MKARLTEKLVTSMVPEDSIVQEMTGPETDLFSMKPEIEN